MTREGCQPHRTPLVLHPRLQLEYGHRSESHSTHLAGKCELTSNRAQGRKEEPTETARRSTGPMADTLRPLRADSSLSLSFQYLQVSFYSTLLPHFSLQTPEMSNRILIRSSGLGLTCPSLECTGNYKRVKARELF